MVVSNPENFDGQAVTSYEAKFAGSFDLHEESGSKMKFGDIVTFLVSAEVGKSEMVSTRSGDLKRTNRCDVIAVNDIDARTWDIIQDVIANPLKYNGIYSQGTIV